MIRVINGLTNEEIATRIKLEISESKDDDLLLLYSRNLGFLTQLSKRFTRTLEDVHEFQQLGYLAVVEAVEAFKPNMPYSFLAYLNKCALHNFYKYVLEMHNPCRVPRNYKKDTEMFTNIINVVPFHDAITVLETLPDTSVSYNDIDNKNISELLWKEVEATLTPVNLFVIKKRYLEQMTLSEIGELLGIGKERVRQRELRSLIKLGRSPLIQELANDYFGLDTRKRVTLLVS